MPEKKAAPVRICVPVDGRFMRIVEISDNIEAYRFISPGNKLLASQLWIDKTAALQICLPVIDAQEFGKMERSAVFSIVWLDNEKLYSLADIQEYMKWKTGRGLRELKKRRV